MPSINYDHQIFSLQDYGGISRYHIDLINGLEEYYSDYFEISLKTFLSSNEYLREKNIRTLPSIKNTKLNFLINELADNIRTTAVRQYHDIHHFTYFYNLYQRSAKKYVMTFHDCIPEMNPQYYKSTKVKMRKQKLLDRCDVILANSNTTSQQMQELYKVDSDKIRVVHLSCNFALTNGSLQERHNYILFVGHRSRYKNFLGLLKAYGNSRTLKENFRVICFGGGDFTIKEKEKIAELGIPFGNVSYAGSDEKVLGNLYKHASAFIFPSHCEGFGIPLIEALSHGTKVCCSDIAIFREVCADSAYYFDPNNSDDIESCIVAALEDDTDKSVHFNRNYFSTERMVRETASVYQELI